MSLPCKMNPIGASHNPYTIGQVIINVSGLTNDIDINLPAGKYLVEAVGGGGGASYSVSGVAMGSGGGSGALIIAELNLPRGRYRYRSGIKANDSNMQNVPQNQTMPAGDSAGLFSFNDNAWCVLAAGGGGAARPIPGGYGGGVAIDRLYVDKIRQNTSGNRGSNGGGWSAGVGGASAYYGFGSGSNGNAPNSNNHGLFKLTYLGGY